MCIYLYACLYLYAYVYIHVYNYIFSVTCTQYYFSVLQTYTIFYTVMYICIRPENRYNTIVCFFFVFFFYILFYSQKLSLYDASTYLKKTHVTIVCFFFFLRREKCTKLRLLTGFWLHVIDKFCSLRLICSQCRLFFFFFNRTHASNSIILIKISALQVSFWRECFFVSEWLFCFLFFNYSLNYHSLKTSRGKIS